MDQETVTLILIGVILLTALLIAVYLVVPRLFRRGSAGMTTATAGASLGGRSVAPRLDRTMAVVGATPDPRIHAPRGDLRASGDPAAAAAADQAGGLLTAAGWGRVVADEDARVRRYRRAATIVMIDIDGLDRLIERLGDTAGDRLIPAVSDTVRRMAREADHVARLGRGRFGVLLPETDEIQAINYVERVRRTCDLWLESGAVSLRLAIGWASATGDDTLHDAARTATERMFVEIHRNARRSADLVPPVSEATDPAAAAESPFGESRLGQA